MNQIKYLLYACMILVVSVLGIRFYSKLSATEFISLSAPPQLGCGNVSLNNPRSAAGGTSGQGQQIFREKCGTCHALDKILSGPALRGVLERGPWANRKNLYKWVANPAAFIPTTQYTRDLQKQYGSVMPGFAGLLTEKDIDAIFEYIGSTGPVAYPMPTVEAIAAH